ncbi:hypothetical protein HKX42_04505 [Salinisphaera sp. USBA-960]|uniref:hypothetical protein n=1 Tax=Salinisphaera orenii TaxID=856731 RepID=UPI000DBE0500|nr:hypothetical protein [Salifodinibacter halophilus]NNC26136.1 hypothetical protein [Salifodinibacter halophilus]
MQLEILDQLSAPGSSHRPNEDAIAVNGQTILVIDGATGVGEQTYIAGQPSDTYWFVQELQRHLSADLARGQPLVPALETACLATRDAFATHAAPNSVPKYAWPSAVFTAATIENGALALYRLGDCGARDLQRPERVFFAPTRLDDQEQTAINALRDEMAAGYSQATAQQRLMPLLRRNRQNMNAVGGYGALTLDTGFAGFIQKTVISKAELAKTDPRILLFSDGFDGALNQMYLSADNMDLTNALTKLRRTEREDANCTRHPRIKRHDDASAVLIRPTCY